MLDNVTDLGPLSLCPVDLYEDPDADLIVEFLVDSLVDPHEDLVVDLLVDSVDSTEIRLNCKV